MSSCPCSVDRERERVRRGDETETDVKEPGRHSVRLFSARDDLNLDLASLDSPLLSFQWAVTTGSCELPPPSSIDRPRPRSCSRQPCQVDDPTSPRPLDYLPQAQDREGRLQDVLLDHRQSRLGLAAADPAFISHARSLQIAVTVRARSLPPIPPSRSPWSPRRRRSPGTRT